MFMGSEDQLKSKINELIKKYMDRGKPEFIPGKSKIPLQVASYGSDEVCEALDSMLSTWVTMGKKVANFEQLFAKYLGIKNATMVNSGSSANLVALSILTNPVLRDKIRAGSEIITPATTWTTTVYPIANVNCKPVLVDVDLDTFNISIEGIEKAITDKTKAIMPV